ncbi:MAG TPA: pyridoxamine 5'-phosphate oxidase family protein [Burkholderiales bacterium]|nr:pyridoxamine 5'-phosphate oxidase family protein [Burkholderiales bacterium]
MTIVFNHVVTSETQLREVIGSPSRRALRKQVAQLDEFSRAFIARSPFLVLSSCDAEGNMDVSPKGDPPGFVRVLDDHTLAIPDRLGNRRADTMKNLIQNPKVALLFLIPGKKETLRVSGTAQIVRDEWVRGPMAIGGKLPDHAIVVHVTEAFFHCTKCVIRSRLWDSQAWPSLAGLPSLAEALVAQGKLEESLEQVQALLEEDARQRLY